MTDAPTQSRAFRQLALAAVLAAPALAGCGGGDDPSDAATSRPSTEAAATATNPSKPPPRRGEAEPQANPEAGRPAVPRGPTTKELVVRDLRKGQGPVVKKGDFLSLYYVAGIYETGEELESSWFRGNPYTLVLEEASAYPGWVEGLPGMRVGGRREIVFPTAPGIQPPGSELGDTVGYVIEVIKAE